MSSRSRKGTLIVKGIRLRQKLLMGLLMWPLLLASSGCVYLIVGGIGAVGGYIVSPDTVEGITSSDEIDVWDAAVEILTIMGVITEQNEESGFLMAKISGAQVSIQIVTLSPSTVKLNVKARKNYLPKIALAQDIFVKVMSHLNE